MTEERACAVTLTDERLAVLVQLCAEAEDARIAAEFWRDVGAGLAEALSWRRELRALREHYTALLAAIDAGDAEQVERILAAGLMVGR